MSKYSVARGAITRALEAGEGDGCSREDVLLALLVTCVADYRSLAGAEAAATALRYELGELDGAIDTQFIRSR
ncbi:MAG: hypothetical protein R3E82_07600 [Pseudomonadales bacterium]|nr:hypothetical protein [Pseudomonadales bacterium]